MGWLFQRDPLRHETPCQYFTRTNTFESDTQRVETLATSATRGVIYGAVRVTEKPTGRAYTLCVVWLYKNNARDGFGYKSMDETMGPVKVDAPARIMALLSPVEEIPGAGYAADWRARVAAQAAAQTAAASKARRLSVGDVVRPGRAVRLTNGWEAEAFRVVELRPRKSPLFEPLNAAGMRCRLTRRLVGASTIEPAGGQRPR